MTCWRKSSWLCAWICGLLNFLTSAVKKWWYFSCSVFSKHGRSSRWQHKEGFKPVNKIASSESAFTSSVLTFDNSTSYPRSWTSSIEERRTCFASVMSCASRLSAPRYQPVPFSFLLGYLLLLKQLSLCWTAVPLIYRVCFIQKGNWRGAWGKSQAEVVEGQRVWRRWSILNKWFSVFVLECFVAILVTFLLVQFFV